MVKKIQTPIKVSVNSGSNHSWGMIWNTVKIIKTRFGIRAKKNVLFMIFLPLYQKPLPISYPSNAQKNMYINAIKIGIEVN